MKRRFLFTTLIFAMVAGDPSFASYGSYSPACELAISSTFSLPRFDMEISLEDPETIVAIAEMMKTGQDLKYKSLADKVFDVRRAAESLEAAGLEDDEIAALIRSTMFSPVDGSEPVSQLVELYNLTEGKHGALQSSDAQLEALDELLQEIDGRSSSDLSYRMKEYLEAFGFDTSFADFVNETFGSTVTSSGEGDAEKYYQLFGINNHAGESYLNEMQKRSMVKVLEMRSSWSGMDYSGRKAAELYFLLAEFQSFEADELAGFLAKPDKEIAEDLKDDIQDSDFDLEELADLLDIAQDVLEEMFSDEDEDDDENRGSSIFGSLF